MGFWARYEELKAADKRADEQRTVWFNQEGERLQKNLELLRRLWRINMLGEAITDAKKRGDNIIIDPLELRRVCGLIRSNRQ